jgi:hypothetical protein
MPSILDLPYSFSRPYRTPCLYRVVDLQITRTFGPRGQLKWYAARPETEHHHER